MQKKNFEAPAIEVLTYSLDESVCNIVSGQEDVISVGGDGDDGGDIENVN